MELLSRFELESMSRGAGSAGARSDLGSECASRKGMRSPVLPTVKEKPSKPEGFEGFWSCFETDADVPRALRDALGRAAEPYITRRGQKWHVDLKGVNARWLEKAGVTQIDVCPDCTACRPDLYWSHRRMGQARGAQIAMICL